MHAMWTDGTFYVGDPTASAQDLAARATAKEMRLS
jgi:transposase